MKTKLFRTVMLGISAALAIASSAVNANGGLDGEVNRMFTDLGTNSNYTAPGAFRSQTQNVLSGGSFSMRAPSRDYQFFSVQLPYAKGSCNGIDWFGGSFSHINSAELKNMLKSITGALGPVAFQMAVEVVSPLFGSMIKEFREIMDKVTAVTKNSCEAAKQILSATADAVGYNRRDSCMQVGSMLGGLGMDAAELDRRCSADSPSILDSVRKSTNPADAPAKEALPFVGNLTWAAIKDNTSLTMADKELILSLLGTTIYPEETSNNETRYMRPSIQNAQDVMLGKADVVGGTTGLIQVEMLVCDEIDKCMNPSYKLKPFLPVSVRVEKLLNDAADAIATRTIIANNSPVIGLVNNTTLPVWKMLSVGVYNGDPSTAKQLIREYKQSIALDFVSAMLHGFIRVGVDAMSNKRNLPQYQKDDWKELVSQAQKTAQGIDQFVSLAGDRNIASSLVASRVSDLERSVRARMPANVFQMIGTPRLGANAR